MELDHPAHPMVILNGNEPYGCHNHPNRAFGWSFEGCAYSMSLKDRRCDGCVHRESWAKYEDEVNADATL